MANKSKNILHLYNRAGFGISASELEKLGNRSPQDVAKVLLKDSEKFKPLTIDHRNAGLREYIGMRNKLSQEERKQLLRTSRQNIAKLNTAWIDRMTSGVAVLRERMTFFWHDHFACKNIVSVYNEDQNNTIRKFALGKFGDLVKEIAKDPAMILFLNNQQNRKKSSNENFARELLELFTIGIGNYSEEDIKNAARAFTGWGIGTDGRYKFKRAQHDFSSKTFMGRTGDFNGDEIIDIILEDKRTAKNITAKIYRYFVNENEDPGRIALLADEFYTSGYDINKLMKSIFTSDWFYDDENIGNRVKSPVDLIAGIMSSYNVKFKNPLALIGIQKILGQMLLNPPNVSGWVSGTKWIDTSSIMFRMKLPEIIFRSSDIKFEFKDEAAGEMDSEMMLEMSKADKKLYKQVRTSIDLSGYYSLFSGMNSSEIIDSLAAFSIQPELSREAKDLVMKYSDTSSKENLIESSLMSLMSLPEFQMC
jgi:uncharacterized protein (DUF1800 family)